MSERLPQIVATYFEAANRHDAAGMAACWKPGGEEVLPALGLTLVAPDGLRAHFDDLFTGIPDVSFHIREHAVDDDLVAIRSVMSGTHRGRYNGLVATRRRFEVDVTDFIRVRDDKIVSNHVVVDALSTLRQLGVLPPLDSRREAALRLLFNGMATLRRFLPKGRTKPRDDDRF